MDSIVAKSIFRSFVRTTPYFDFLAKTKKTSNGSVKRAPQK